MEHQDNLFKDFEAVTAEAWLEKITLDLKGKDPVELNHQVGENIVLSPFHHADTMAGTVAPVARDANGNEWLIGEAFRLEEDLQLTNKSILHALENGTQAITITIGRKLTESDLAKLFAEIEPSYIYTHLIFNETIDPIEILTEFEKVLVKKKGDKTTFFGSISQKKTGPVGLEKWMTSKLPNFKTCCIDASFGDPVDQLTILIKKGVDELANSEDLTIANQIVFSVKIGTDFFLEIARLRALRILWANVLKSYGVDPTIFPRIMVNFDLSSQTKDPNQNMIRATTMAMAAALGGADLLTVMPADSSDEHSTTFYRRIARNIQHILKMESFIDRVQDVARGSYYIETLTTKIGEAVWANLDE